MWQSWGWNPGPLKLVCINGLQKAHGKEEIENVCFSSKENWNPCIAFCNTHVPWTLKSPCIHVHPPNHIVPICSQLAARPASHFFLPFPTNFAVALFQNDTFLGDQLTSIIFCVLLHVHCLLNVSNLCLCLEAETRNILLCDSLPLSEGQWRAWW